MFKQYTGLQQNLTFLQNSKYDNAWPLEIKRVQNHPVFQYHYSQPPEGSNHLVAPFQKTSRTISMRLRSSFVARLESGQNLPSDEHMVSPRGPAKHKSLLFSRVLKDKDRFFSTEAYC